MAVRARKRPRKDFAELRPDLPERLHEETERLLKEPADDHDLTLYLALIGMADPVAEGETERDRIRAEVLEEQRVEREKLANERAEMERHIEEERQKLVGEGEELRAAFEKEKANLEREFAAAQGLIAAERTEMQRIVTEERAELAAKRDALEKVVSERIAEIERAAEADRATIEALRERIQKAGEAEMERKRTTALEELDDAEIKLNTGRYATPRFVEPQLEPLPGLKFSSDGGLREEADRSAGGRGGAVAGDEPRGEDQGAARQADRLAALGGARWDRGRHPDHCRLGDHDRESLSGRRDAATGGAQTERSGEADHPRDDAACVGPRRRVRSDDLDGERIDRLDVERGLDRPASGGSRPRGTRFRREAVGRLGGERATRVGPT